MAHTFKVGDKVLVGAQGFKVFDASHDVIVLADILRIAPLGDIADDIEGIPAALEVFAAALVDHHQDPQAADPVCDLKNAASALKEHAQRLADEAERLFKEWEGTPPT